MTFSVLLCPVECREHGRSVELRSVLPQFTGSSPAVCAGSHVQRRERNGAREEEEVEEGGGGGVGL